MDDIDKLLLETVSIDVLISSECFPYVLNNQFSYR